MSRICDNCKHNIPLGADKIEVRFIGEIRESAEALFKKDHLDFCSLKCLAEYWSNDRYIVHTNTKEVS